MAGVGDVFEADGEFIAAHCFDFVFAGLGVEPADNGRQAFLPLRRQFAEVLPLSPEDIDFILQCEEFDNLESFGLQFVMDGIF